MSPFLQITDIDECDEFFRFEVYDNDHDERPVGFEVYGGNGVKDEQNVLWTLTVEQAQGFISTIEEILDRYER